MSQPTAITFTPDINLYYLIGSTAGGYLGTTASTLPQDSLIPLRLGGNDVWSFLPTSPANASYFVRSKAYPQLCLTLDARGEYPLLDRCRNAAFWAAAYVRGGAEDGFTLTTSRSGQTRYLGVDGGDVLRAFESGTGIKYLWTYIVTSQKVDILVGSAAVSPSSDSAPTGSFPSGTAFAQPATTTTGTTPSGGSTQQQQQTTNPAITRTTNPPSTGVNNVPSTPTSSVPSKASSSFSAFPASAKAWLLLLSTIFIAAVALPGN